MENSRLKFRVWDIRNKEYFKDPNPTPPLNSDGTLGFTYDKLDFQKYYIIEQCTGLSDKNGNLIYEGDIVKSSYGRKGVVSFGKYTGCFAAGPENIYVDLFGWYLDDYYEPDDCGRLRVNLDNSHSPITEEDASDFEIIGNVHEQAEQKETK